MHQGQQDAQKLPFPSRPALLGLTQALREEPQGPEIDARSPLFRDTDRLVVFAKLRRVAQDLVGLQGSQVNAAMTACCSLELAILSNDLGLTGPSRYTDLGVVRGRRGGVLGESLE